MIETPVLVVGGGPVGLTLAGELGWRGVSCTLVEERTSPTEHPKATLLGARSMELFRRWGITDEIYANALPAHINYFITFTTRLAGRELYRVTSPSIEETISRPPDVVARYRELQWSPFYKTQIGQQALEPVLWKFAERHDNVALRHGWRFLDFTENEDGVVSHIENVETGRIEQVRSSYLIACDGGPSGVRRKLGIKMGGRGRMRGNISFYFESEEFLKVHRRGLGNLYLIFAPDSFGVFTAVDGNKRWSYQFYFLDADKQTEDLDATAILHRAVGQPFDFELKSTQRWHHHQSVAQSWRSRLPDETPGRVFLAGDAAHLFTPTGGVGMNTGIGDAIDLGWKIDAVLKGWGGPNLLSSYERERKPIAVRNSVISANNADKTDMVMSETPSDIDEESPRGDRLRAELVEKIKWMSRQYNSAGTHLGYRYIDSPIIVGDGSPEPPDDPAQVVPSTWPGSRAPHGWTTADESLRGRSTLDWFGRDFVLVTADSAAAAEVGQAFRSLAIPFRVQEIADTGQLRLFERKHVLVRPDGHVAWRGDAIPTNVEELVNVVRGF